MNVLKDVINRYVPEQYDFMFREQLDGTYSAYVNSTNANEKVRRNVKGKKQEDLYATIKKLLKGVDETDEQVAYVKAEMDLENFLPKQLTSANGVIPNQAHSAELLQILENASKYHPFLLDVDETGLTVAEKIQQVFEFQIPYYIGPLSDLHKGKGGNAWVEFKEGTSGRILPWNFEQRIDTMASAENFIAKMVRHCTYLGEETCVPDTSLIYERFKVLNELNNLKVNGEKISVELKQNIYNDLFLKGKKVKKKQLENYLLKEGHIGSVETADITGIDGDFTNSLSSYGKFVSIFGDEDMKLDSIKVMVEDIIFWATIYGEDKKFLRARILDKYEGKVTDEQLKRICGIKFKEWGNLSRSFLELEGCDKNIGEVRSLIQMMWDSNENLMQLLSDHYTFKETLENTCKKLEKSLSEFTYDDLQDTYLSTPVKRMVWQTIQIIQELSEVLGNPPAKIFVEMARGEQEKVRTVSRKNKLLDLYKACKKECDEFENDLVDKLKKNEERDLRSKKLYLYYVQKGKCMYSGERISMNDLFDNNKYDLDHIYPQSYVKDDSLENNLVLVDKRINAGKSDTFPLDAKIYDKCVGLWRSLEKGGFITKEKYKRLTRKDGFTDDEMAGFVNRQLVETRQGTKAVTQLLKQTCPESDVIYVKANNVSNFRMDSMFIENRGKENEVDRRLVKSRLVNDFHHAHDAYLNIVVGNVYNTKFTNIPLNYIKSVRASKENHIGKNPYHMDKMFRFDVERDGRVAWKVKAEEGKECSRDTVLRMLGKATPLISHMTISGHGAISDVQPISAMKCKEKGYIALKGNEERMSDVTQYGGLTSVSTGFFTLIEHTDKKSNRIRQIEAMPLYKFSGDVTEEKIKVYCEDVLGLVDVSVRYKKIPMHAELKINGYNVRITGKTNNEYLISNMTPLVLEQKYVKWIKSIEEMVKLDNILKIKNRHGIMVDKIDEEMTLELYQELLHKHTNTILNKKRNSISRVLTNIHLFEELSLKDKYLVIYNVLLNTELKNKASDLRLIGGVKTGGKMQIGCKINGFNEIKLINKSTTGLFIKEVDLLTV